MTDITDETEGWTVAMYHESGGLMATWCITWDKAINEMKPKEKDYMIRIVRRKYKDRMQL